MSNSGSSRSDNRPGVHGIGETGAHGSIYFDSLVAKELVAGFFPISDAVHSVAPKNLEHTSKVSGPQGQRSALSVRAGGVGLGQLVDDFFVRTTALACWVSVATGTRAILNIGNKIVARSWGNPHGHGVQSQSLPGFPGDSVGGTRGVSAYSEGS